MFNLLLIKLLLKDKLREINLKLLITLTQTDQQLV